MAAALGELQQLGFRVGLVFPGSLGLDEFRELNLVPKEIPLYADESSDRQLFKALKFQRAGLSSIFRGSMWKAIGKLDRKRGNVKGDKMQMGGVVALDSGGNEWYRFVQTKQEEYDDPQNVLAAARSRVAGQ
eukprot:comp13027_c0_seq1/m.17597 comp13027_c0_seq1/g.17597  ORF comp13027_c0_seq1/g.17597 comp13027_c0_seq1/m.17597 type:complete len:132 (+) comp13027_c0_seq1:173-568(+)